MPGFPKYGHSYGVQGDTSWKFPFEKLKRLFVSREKRLHLIKYPGGSGGAPNYVMGEQ